MPFQRGNKYGGARNRKSDVAQTPTRRPRRYAEDEEMVDGEGEDDEGLEVAVDDEEMEGDGGTPAGDEEEDDDEDAPPTITAMPSRRRGRGRGGRGAGRRSMRAERHDYGTPQPLDGDGEENSESGTPFRRRRGRPDGSGRPRGRGGFRGRRRGQQPEAPRVVIDKDGRALDVLDDEVQVDDDEEGNEKVDSNGTLLGGREYRVRTFRIQGKDDRLYMLSTEPARCCGFRDSYLFFTKHPKLFKVLLPEDAKKDLIDREILPSSYKGRNIGVVTARSVFREFGARIIVGGRKIIDDYKVAQARENGVVEGELADPDDRIPENKEDYDRNRYVAWFGASEVYRQVGQAVPGKSGPMGKRRTNITVSNWQFMHAREASRFNASAAAARRANLDGVYDAHTNMMFYPTIMQPTHAKWEQIPPPNPLQSQLSLPNGLTNGHHAPNGTAANDTHDDAMEVEDLPRPTSSSQHPTIFPAVPALVSRNFSILDTYFTSPSLTSAAYPGPDGSVLDPPAGPNGLSSISADILDELPEECRRAFEAAKKVEMDWQKQWGTEGESALRGGLKIGLNGYPV